MQDKRLTGLSLLVASVFLTGTAALAGPSATDASATSAQKRFELSAQMSQRPSLSRNEVDAGAVNPLSAPGAKPPAAAAISYLGQTQPARFSTPPPKVAAASPPCNQPADAAHASLIERNVDWSSWVSKEADRWYYVLRTYENGLNAQFVTERAALFE